MQSPQIAAWAKSQGGISCANELDCALGLAASARPHWPTTTLVWVGLASTIVRSEATCVLMNVFSYSVSPAATNDRTEWRLHPVVEFQEFTNEERCSAPFDRAHRLGRSRESCLLLRVRDSKFGRMSKFQRQLNRQSVTTA